MRADAELRYLAGVGPRRATRLAELAIVSLEDLLYVLPFRHEDRTAYARVADLVAGGPDTTLDVRVVESRLIRTRKRGLTIFRATLEDQTGRVVAVWYNQPYLERVMVGGRRAVLFGRPVLDRTGRALQIDNPDYEMLDDADAEGIHTGRIVPVYRKLADMTSRMQRSLVHRALHELEPATLPEVVPPEIAAANLLLARLAALRGVHFPCEGTSLHDLHERRTPAHRTLAFEEIFLIQLALALRRAGLREEGRGIAYRVDDALRTRLAALLPFRLTPAQKRVLKEIGADLQSPHPMNRLLQGDVGSGKTIVALLTLLVAVENGYQGALMAPTEILAEQHYRNVVDLLRSKGAAYQVDLFTGSLRAAERRRRGADLMAGRTQIAVGTHALFEEAFAFRRLGLVVVDEQHRFGVMQRAALARKGERPDVLVMTATPIPRSLALTLYGDLDLSLLDELPPGRTPVVTVVRGEADRQRVYGGIRMEAMRGRQVYVVVPLVEETEKSDLKAAIVFAEHLRTQILPDLSVDLVHGRMKAMEKDRVMTEFGAGRIQVLVATTVIEVGVDVPNASVMVVEHAERFGLSQLHQLRGRVGRGSARSYCVLMVGEEGAGALARRRLQVMERTHDGFEIAETDLALRGPGVVFGTAQHGLADLQFLELVLKDPSLLEAARGAAREIAAGSRQRAERLQSSLRPSWRRRLALAQVG